MMPYFELREAFFHFLLSCEASICSAVKFRVQAVISCAHVDYSLLPIFVGLVVRHRCSRLTISWFTRSWCW